jgi:hypothetical protein
MKRGSVVKLILGVAVLILLDIVGFGVIVPTFIGGALDFMVIGGYIMIVALIIANVVGIWGMIKYGVKNAKGA